MSVYTVVVVVIVEGESLRTSSTTYQLHFQFSDVSGLNCWSKQYEWYEILQSSHTTRSDSLFSWPHFSHTVHSLHLQPLCSRTFVTCERNKKHVLIHIILVFKGYSADIRIFSEIKKKNSQNWETTSIENGKGEKFLNTGNSVKIKKF